MCHYFKNWVNLTPTLFSCLLPYARKGWSTTCKGDLKRYQNACYYQYQNGFWNYSYPYSQGFPDLKPPEPPESPLGCSLFWLLVVCCWLPNAWLGPDLRNVFVGGKTKTVCWQISISTFIYLYLINYFLILFPTNCQFGIAKSSDSKGVEPNFLSYTMLTLLA